jgi:aryl-alcohol dehydrogenase-like predicted oxidoreductase
MTALAIQYVLDEPRISCTIPGARSVEQLESNAEAASAPPLTPHERKRIAEIRKRLPG